MTRVAVVGASGAAGALAAHLVSGHPGLELSVAYSGERQRHLRALYPQYDFELERTVVWGGRDLQRSDAAIVAVPHGEAAGVVEGLFASGVGRVVDLSEDHRDGSRRAAYGLTEWNAPSVREARLVANPGCYPTAALLALTPVSHFLKDAVVFAAEGASGLGANAGHKAHFSSVSENAYAYAIGGHRHRAEISRELGWETPLAFVPHLIPLDQGEIVTCVAALDGEWTQRELRSVYEDCYGGSPFVRVRGDGEVAPPVRAVRGTNRCEIGLALEPGGRLVVCAAIDNLWKGAAGQAIQNLNVMLGLDETAGL